MVVVNRVKGSDRQCMGVELKMQFCKEFFKIQLRPIRRFYCAYLFSKSRIFATLTFSSLNILKITDPQNHPSKINDL